MPDLESSQKVLAFVGTLLVLLAVLSLTGALGAALAAVGRLVNVVLEGGFRAWERLFSRVPWPVLLLAIVALHAAYFLGHVAGFVPLVVGALLLTFGVTACVAYMVIEQERYEVARGYKVLHSPLKGQEVAHHLVRYGPRVGLPMLVLATLASLSGFALLNLGLYETLFPTWYTLGTHPAYVKVADFPPLPAGESAVPGFGDFLVYSILNLTYTVGLVDGLNAARMAEIAYVHPARWPATVLFVLFRLFFTAVLVQQIFAWLRNLRLLQDTVRDFWSPHEPIQQRAGETLATQGPRAVGLLMRSMGEVDFLTPEQRRVLPAVIAQIGPSSAPLLVGQLQSPLEHVRDVAVAALGELRSIESLSALCERRADPSPRVRAAVAGAIGAVFKPGAAAVKKSWRMSSGSRRRGSGSGLVVIRSESGDADDPSILAAGALEALVADADRPVQLAALAALASIGEAAARVTPAVAKLAGDEDAAVRAAAAETLGALPGPSRPRVNALIELLADETPAVRLAALKSVAAIGAEARLAVPRVLTLVQDPDPETRTAAAEAVAAVGKLDDALLPDLLEGLRSVDNLERVHAAEAIGTIGPAAAKALPRLEEAARDGNDRVRAAATGAIGKLGEAAAGALDTLRAAFRDEDYRTCARAAESVGRLGAAGRPAEPELIGALKNVNAIVRQAAVEALVAVGTPAERAVPALLGVVGDDSPAVRVALAGALGAYPPLGAVAEGGIDALLKDATPEVVTAAIDALGKLEPAHPVLAAKLRPLLASPDDAVAARAARALGAVGVADAQTLDALSRLVREAPEAGQVAGLAALAAIGPAAAPARDALEFALRRGTAAAREEALKALAQVAPEAALENFLSGLSDADEDVRVYASGGLVKLSPLPADRWSEELAAAVTNTLRDPSTRVRANAAAVLASQGPPPEDAVAPLVECSADPDDGLRLNAVRALRTVPESLAEQLPRLLADPNAQVALLAATMLLQGDEDHAEAAGLVARSLVSGPPRDRRLAADAIEALAERGHRFAEVVNQQAAREEDAELKARLTTLGAELAKADAAEQLAAG